MHATEFFRKIETSSVAPVYLFKGEADFMMEEAWRKLLDKIVPVKARRFNGERVRAKDCSAAIVMEKLSSLPMFGTRRLLMVQGFEVWAKEGQNAILSYLAKPYPTSCLVLASSQKKGIERVETAVNAVGIVVVFAAPTERETPRWLQERAKQQNKTLSSQAATFLTDQVGLDLHRLDSELEKLALYVGDRKRIEVEDVREGVGDQRNFSIYELTNHVSRRRRSLAVRCLRNLMRAGEAPLAVIGLLSRQIRILWQIKDGIDKGTPLAELNRHLRLPQYVFQNYVKESALYSEGQLQEIHRAIREADLSLKSTGTNPELVMEDLILRISEHPDR
jgi:DNA polymerase III subunit delta